MTDIVLNQLYPGGVLKQLGDAAGGVTYDQYAPGGCVRQLYTASGLDDPLDQYAQGGPIHQIEVELEGGGGNGAPDWVPADAKIHIDLVGGEPQGRAWVEGVGVVAVDTLLGSDPNTENAWDVTVYNPEQLIVDGYAMSDPVALIGATLAKLLAGATVRVKIKDNDSLQNFDLEMLSGSGVTGVSFVLTNANVGLNPRKARTSSWIGPTALTIANPTNQGVDAVNVVAFTTTSTRSDVAANGSDVASLNLTENDYPASGADQIICALIDALTPAALQSITLYDALPSTAGLSELSETGVTNTAPHDITYALAGDDVTGSTPFDITIPESVVSSGFSPFLVDLAAIDDEGNPVVFSLSDDGGGKFAIVADVPELAPGSANKVTSINPLSIGPHDFTVRATDSGGLYVEQEFTITVTA
jgi:hypothetical protein